MSSHVESEMGMRIEETGKAATRVFINAGCGYEQESSLPAYFGSWQQIRIDIDASTRPDLLTSLTDMSAIADATVHAVWSSHCLEHLYSHEVPLALSEFRRVLREDGFAVLVVPDLQVIASLIAEDRLDEVLYESPSGPVTAHDVIWGFGPALASGKTAMAHHCGFTPNSFLKNLAHAGFEEILLRRKSSLELVALALCYRSEGAEHREQILAELGF